jgi:hypothetical protein
VQLVFKDQLVNPDLTVKQEPWVPLVPLVLVSQVPQALKVLQEILDQKEPRVPQDPADLQVHQAVPQVLLV